LRETNEGLEKIADREEVCSIRRQGNRVILNGAIAALVSTGLIVFAA
jgi:hypothetical protein